MQEQTKRGFLEPDPDALVRFLPVDESRISFESKFVHIDEINARESVKCECLICQMTKGNGK